MTSVGTRTAARMSLNVELHRGAERRQRRPRAEASAHVPDEPVAKAVVVGDLGRPLAARGPPGSRARPTRRGPRRAPRAIPPRSAPTGSRSERVPFTCGSKRTRPAHRSGYVAAKSTPMPVLVDARPEHGSLRGRRVHHGPHVVHRRLDRLHLPHTIREPRATLVEHQHASRFGETLDVAHEQRLLPGREQIAGVPRTKTRSGGPVPTTW